MSASFFCPAVHASIADTPTPLLSTIYAPFFSTPPLLVDRDCLLPSMRIKTSKIRFQKSPSVHICKDGDQEPIRAEPQVPDGEPQSASLATPKTQAKAPAPPGGRVTRSWGKSRRPLLESRPQKKSKGGIGNQKAKRAADALANGQVPRTCPRVPTIVVTTPEGKVCRPEDMPPWRKIRRSNNIPGTCVASELVPCPPCPPSQLRRSKRRRAAAEMDSTSEPTGTRPSGRKLWA
jgi:hypothetical protein